MADFPDSLYIEESPETKLFLVIKHKGGIVVVPFWHREIPGYIRFQYRETKWPSGERYRTYQVSRDVIGWLSVTDDVITKCLTWEAIHEELGDNWNSFEVTKSSLLALPRVERAQAVMKTLLPLHAVQNCFRLHYPGDSARWDSISFPVSLESLLS